MTIETVPALTENEISCMQEFKKFLQKKVIERAELLERTASLEYSQSTDYTLILDIIRDCKNYIFHIDALLGDK